MTIKRENQIKRFGRFLGAVALLATVLTPGVCRALPVAPGPDLMVDVSKGNSPYTVGSDLNYANEYIGTTSGGGILNQDSFTNSVTTDLFLGLNNGSSGTFNLTGGRLLVENNEYLGKYGSGTFNQTGGIHAVGNNLVLGRKAGGSGTYSLSGDNSRLLVFNNEFIGKYGSGTFNQTGGIHAVANNLVLGRQVSGSGIYNLSGDNSRLLVVNNEFIGKYGSGTFNQTGGSNAVFNNLVLGRKAGGSGIYNLSGGSLKTGFAEFIGLHGTGSFNQTGGSNATRAVLVGYGGTGSYNLSGGSLKVYGPEIIGLGGTGNFSQNGGSNSAWVIGLLSGSTGTYDLSGGSLTARGIFGNLQNGGTFIPWKSGSYIDGKYTQSAAGTLQINIASPSNYGNVSVSDSASLNGTLKPVLLNGYVPTQKQVFSGVLKAPLGYTGTFSSVGNFTPTLVGRALYNSTSVDLMAVRDYTNSALTLTPNQWQVGNMLNSLADGATGDLNNVLHALDSLTDPGQVANAFQQISADKFASLTTLGFAGATLVQQGLSNRITNLRYGWAGGGFSGLGGMSLNGSSLDGLMLAYNSSNLAKLLTATRRAAPETRWGAYLNPGLILGSQDSTANQTGFDFTIAGFTGGVDYRVRPDLLVGLASGYGHTGAALRGSGGGVENNTWPISVYAAYLPKSFYAYGSLGYALNLFNLERHIDFGNIGRTAKSSTTGNQLNAYGEMGYDLKTGRLVVTPMVSLAYSGLWVGGFTESGAGSLDLKVDSQHADSLQTGVGAKIAVPLKRGPVKVVPQAYATYQHEYAENSRGLDARLSQGGNTFTFQTEQLGQNFADVGADVTILARQDLAVQLDYNAEVGRDNYTAHNVNVSLRWEF